MTACQTGFCNDCRACFAPAEQEQRRMTQVHKVATDALATLGTIIDDKQGRDAIHLAVEPVVASEKLHPGQHVLLRDGRAVGCIPAAGVGIVDPFLAAPVYEGQRFWLVVYPRTITSLRHVWEHPSFPVEGASALPDKDKEASEKWLREWCRNNDTADYGTVMECIRDGTYNEWSDEYFQLPEGIDGHASIPSEFWDHVEIVLGRPVPARSEYFSCSC